MCEYLSFYVSGKGKIYVGNYASHSSIWVPHKDAGMYDDLREAEWVGNDRGSLKVRNDPGNWFKAQILGQYKTRAALLKDFPVGKIFSDDTGQPRYVKLFQTKNSKKISKWFVIESVEADFHNIKKIYSIYKGKYSDSFQNAQLLDSWPGPCINFIEVENRRFRVYIGTIYFCSEVYNYKQLSGNIILLFKELGLVWKNRKLSFTG